MSVSDLRKRLYLTLQTIVYRYKRAINIREMTPFPFSPESFIKASVL